MKETLSLNSSALSDKETSAPPHFHNFNGEYFRMINTHGMIDHDMFFWLRTGQPPSSVCYRDINGLAALKAVCDHYGTDLRYSIKSAVLSPDSSGVDQRNILIQVSPDLVMCHLHHEGELILLYTDRVHESEISKINEIVLSHPQQTLNDKLNLLLYQPEFGGFRLKDFVMPDINCDVSVQYNDDFAAISELIMQRLSEAKSKGIVLLHGLPGTGKTSYIRYIVRQLNKKMIYIPSSQAGRLGDPEFLPFLLRHPDSILIIEDAEEILQERQNGQNGAISNLLNLSDGLLSDCLNIQIICTFNAPIARIDQALLRKGRIIASYNFRPLTKEKANQLLSMLQVPHQTNNEMTLAEIYHLKDRDFVGQPKAKIGFGGQ
jgi:hypothetical protein